MLEALMILSNAMTAKTELELRQEDEVICHYRRLLKDYLSLHIYAL